MRPDIGFTLVVCTAPGCHTEQLNRVAASLRDCVRSSRHGVLVVSGCTLGSFACRLRPVGSLVLVQPCDAQRRPTAPAIRVGPLCSDDDVAAVQTWIRTARLDPALLPPHLIGLHRTTRAATHN